MAGLTYSGYAAGVVNASLCLLQSIVYTELSRHEFVFYGRLSVLGLASAASLRISKQLGDTVSKKNSREGYCKLTKSYGKFVDSHILPKALTRADGLALGLLQIGQGRKDRRWSSWYDPALVIEEGETILSEYDNWAIATLRKHKMVWSGWGPMQALSDVVPIPGVPWGYRIIKSEDSDEFKRLRLFFLSLLWRAAASDRKEFDEIVLPSDHLEILRKMVLDRVSEPLDFYPATLTQLSTLGVRHNQTPITITKNVPSMGGNPGWEEPAFRFFIDGLIIHFSRLSIEENAARDLSPMQVGCANRLTVSTVPYESSSQAKNLAIVSLESELGKPLPEPPYRPFPARPKPFK